MKTHDVMETTACDVNKTIVPAAQKDSMGNLVNASQINSSGRGDRGCDFVFSSIKGTAIGLPLNFDLIFGDKSYFTVYCTRVRLKDEGIRGTAAVQLIACS